MKQRIPVYAPGTTEFLSTENNRRTMAVRCKTEIASDRPLLSDYLRLHHITNAIHEFTVSAFGSYIDQSVITGSGSFTLSLKDSDCRGLNEHFRYISDTLFQVFSITYNFSYSVDRTDSEIAPSSYAEGNICPHLLFAVRPVSAKNGLLEETLWSIKNRSPRSINLPDGLLVAGLPGAAADSETINRYSGRQSLLFSDVQLLIITDRIDNLFRLAAALHSQYMKAGMPMSAEILHPGTMEIAVPDAEDNRFTYAGEEFSWQDADTILNICSGLEKYRNSATPREYKSLSAGLYKASYELSEKYKSGYALSLKDAWCFRYSLRDAGDELTSIYNNILSQNSHDRIPMVNPLVFGVASQLTGLSDNY